MRCLAAIFDFDYTLGDSTSGVIESMNYAFVKMGCPLPTTDEIRRTIGISLDKAFGILTGRDDPEDSKEFVRLFMARADEVMTESSTLYPASKEVLTRLKQSGIKTGIVTTKAHYRIDAIFKRFDALHLIDVVVGSDDIINVKPAPDALLAALKTLSVSPDEAIYTGDNLVDAQAAQAAGIRFIAVTTGTTPRDAFIDYPNISIMENISQLFDVIQ